MNEKKGNAFLKTAIGILAICLLALGFYTFQFYHESQSNQDILEQEQASLKMELKDLLSKYETAKTTNELLKKDFSEAKQEIKRLIDSIENTEVSYVYMRKYKMKLNSLKKEKEALFQTIDSLSSVNKSLKTQVESTKTKLVQTTKRTDSLVVQNEKLAAKVSEASRLKILQLTAEGVVFQNKGEHKPVSKAARAEKIQVCFTLAKNELTSPGKKRLYVQIINPKDNLLGEKSTISFGEAVLNYSKIVDATYENQALEVCALVDTEKSDLVKGRYIVNVFIGPELLSSKLMELE